MSWHHVKAISSGLGKFASSERRNTENNKEFSMFWRSEESNFPNSKEIAFSLHQNIDGTSSVLASWKIEFSESETYRFVRAPKEHEAISVLPPLENRIFRIRNKSQLSSNFLRFGAFKNVYSESEKNRFFVTPKPSFTIMTLWKCEFSKSERNRFFITPKQPWWEF